MARLQRQDPKLSPFGADAQPDKLSPFGADVQGCLRDLNDDDDDDDDDGVGIMGC